MIKTEPKKINWADKTFAANGKNYNISTTMSIGRSVYAEEAKIELERGVRVGQTTESFLEIFNLLNAGKPAEAAVKTYNHVKAIDNFFERPEPVLRICACYLNYDGEDVRFITDELVREKINDWSEEGIARESFFLLALTFISEETADLKNFTAHISEVVKREAQKMMEATPISESSN